MSNQDNELLTEEERFNLGFATPYKSMSVQFIAVSGSFSLTAHFEKMAKIPELRPPFVSIRDRSVVTIATDLSKFTEEIK